MAQHLGPGGVLMKIFMSRKIKTGLFVDNQAILLFTMVISLRKVI